MEIFVVLIAFSFQFSENKQQVLLYNMPVVTQLCIPAFHSFCILVQPLSVFQ